MTINVSGAVSRLAAPATLSVRSEDTYDNGGNRVAGAEVETDISAAIMQMKPAELRDLPEGIREEATGVCWTVSKIRVDDRIEQSGRAYRVLMIQDRHHGNYYRAILGKVK